MDIYLSALRAIKMLFSDIGKNEAAAVIGGCIAEYEKNDRSNPLKRELSHGGRLYELTIGKEDVPEADKRLWTIETFQALVAICAQTAESAANGFETDIQFLRNNFGRINDIMMIGRCRRCGRREATAADIDKYLSKPIISKRIVDGLENGDLDDEVGHLIHLDLPELDRERRRLRRKLTNSEIPINDGYGILAVCNGCASEDIEQSRLLRHTKENRFVPLNN